MGQNMGDGGEVVQFNRSAALIELAKQEQRRLLQLIHESQATIVRSRELEHVPPELNRQDSHGVLDRRFYRH